VCTKWLSAHCHYTRHSQPLHCFDGKCHDWFKLAIVAITWSRSSQQLTSKQDKQNELNENMSDNRRSIEAQAYIHHQYCLGLQLMVAMREGPDAIGDWMFRMFRRQHEDKFLSSFEKLGLSDLPDAVACAQYHTLSNRMGGVPVEYMAETEKKAWVRFRYPRWMYDGPTLCGVPVEASRGFRKGWYAQNG